MKRVVACLLAVGIFFSCSKDAGHISISDQNYLVFGHFYGQCVGETCVETFKLTDTKLYEDITDHYSGQDLVFVELDHAQFEGVKDLPDFFPAQLLEESETFIGCPDCADGGGLFIQYAADGNLKSWRIDQEKSNVPAYLHDFMDKVNEKIAFINN